MADKSIDKERIKNAVREILLAMDEDPEREGLRQTPERVAKMFEELLGGYGEKEIETPYFTQRSDLVILKNLKFYSLCEHHILPFFLNICVAYIPKGQIIGISKLVRLVEKYTMRLQLQERLTEQIADEMVELTNSPDCMVVVRGEHLCMRMRGVKNPGEVITSAVRGGFLKDWDVRMEVLKLLEVV